MIFRVSEVELKSAVIYLLFLTVVFLLGAFCSE